MDRILENITNASYSDLVSVICIPLIISILAIATPLLSESKYKIESKYTSKKIRDIFNESYVSKFFNSILITSLIAVLLWLLQIPRFEFNNEVINCIIENSAWLFLLISTILLVVMLFLYMNLLDKFNDSYHLINYIKRNYEKTKQKKQYFEAISELFYFSIVKSKEDLGRDILDFFANCFSSYKEGKENKPIEFPSEYYELIYQANERINAREKKVSSLFNEAIMLDFLIVDYQNTIISEKTYSWLWRSMRQALFHNSTDIVYAYWRKAHQHISLFLKPIYADYNDKFEITNQVEIDNRNLEIKRYKEFHYVLGALILYTENFDLLSKSMSFTQSIPAKYYLVPNTSIELIHEYISIKRYFTEPIYYESRYSFPDAAGVETNGIILMWIRRYFSILFLRQYEIGNNFSSNYYEITLPQLPETLLELSHWKESIEILRDNIKFYLEKDILQKINIAYLFKTEILEEKKQEEPIKMLNEYIKSIEEKYQEIQRIQKLSSNKIDEFKKNSVKKIKSTYQKITQVTNSNYVKEVNLTGSSFIGLSRYDILTKGAFAENQDISYSGSSSITAQGIIIEMLYYLTISFATISSIKYSVYYDDIFKAIDKLNISETEKGKYIIISIGLNFNHIKSFNTPQKLTEKEDVFYYDNIQIIEIGYSQADIVNNSLFIMEKADLPSLTKHDLTEEIIKKYNLELIDQEYKIYGNILDLNEYPDIKEEIEKKYSGKEDLSKSVLSFVGVKYELRWNKKAKAIKIKVYNSFDQYGNINNLSEIKPIKI